jgi:tetratricopeptide (TPR) repeat protein
MRGRFANLELEDGRSEERSLPTLVRQTRETQVGSAAGYLNRARAEYRWGQFEAALRLYTRALQEDRALIPAWVGQVQMLVELDECHEGRVWSDKALELFRNNGDLLAAKAQACVRLRDLSAGLACSDASLQAPDSSAWRWQVRGEVLLARQQKHADECFQKAVAEPAADWFDRVICARINLCYRRFTNALHYLKEAAQLEPTHGYIWFQMGDCQCALGLTAAAQSSYERCLELRPGFTDAERALDALVSGGQLLRWLRGIIRRWG